MRLSTTSIRICYIVFVSVLSVSPYAAGRTLAQGADVGQEVALAPLQFAYSPENGQPHADFVLPSIEDGSPVRLSDFRGKKVLLLHFASW